jgi:hypothetical protein
MSNGKAKGSGFERDIAKFLTKYVTGQDKPLCFWRSPSSGILGTIAESMDASGDIIALRPEGVPITQLFSIEIKTGYEDVDLLKMFKSNKNNTLESFWKQCIRDARKAEKYGLLIFRKKGYNVIIGIENNVVIMLKKQKVELPKSIIINFNNDLPDMVMYSMEDFFNCVKIENIKKLKFSKVNI